MCTFFIASNPSKFSIKTKQLSASLSNSYQRCQVYFAFRTTTLVRKVASEKLEWRGRIATFSLFVIQYNTWLIMEQWPSAAQSPTIHYVTNQAISIQGTAVQNSTKRARVPVPHTKRGRSVRRITVWAAGTSWKCKKNVFLLDNICSLAQTFGKCRSCDCTLVLTY